MKRIVVAALLIAGTAAWAQVSNPSIVVVASAPSGSCTQNLPDQQVVSLGTIYTCQSWTWALVGGGGSMTWPTSAGIVVYGGSSAWGTSLTAPTGAIIGAGQANTYTTGLQDFSSATMKLPASYTIAGPYTITQPAATGTLALTSQIPAVGTWGALNYPSWASGTPFVKMTAAGTFSLDTNTYLTASGLSGMTQYGLSVAASATTVTSSVQPASWTTGHTFVPVWQPSGSALAPTVVDANTLVVSSATSATTATNATNVATTTKSDNTEYYLGLYPANSSSNQAAVVVGAHYNASTGAVTLPAGASLGTSDTGTPRFTASTNLWTSNVALAAPSFTGTGTTPAAMRLVAGSGSIPALTANSAGFAAPATGGTAFLYKLPATAAAGILHAAAPASNDGVNESALTSSAVSLSADVSGVLPVANGGTGSAVADTTFTVSTSTTINANSCTPASGSGGTSVTMTNLTSAMTLAITPNADITNTTGWGNPAAGVLYVTLAPGSGAFTYHVCNNTASNITTSGSVTFNVSAR
jgi:hypothetical protein